MTNYTITEIATITGGHFECDSCGPSTEPRNGVILRVNETLTTLCRHCHIYG